MQVGKFNKTVVLLLRTGTHLVLYTREKIAYCF